MSAPPRILVFWSAGGNDRRLGGRFRMIVGDPMIEVMSHDRLGVTTWIPVGNSAISPVEALSRAVAVALAPLDVADRLEFIKMNANVGGRIWPEGVTKTALGLEIELGNVTK